jgi:hypothetical protein
MISDLLIEKHLADRYLSNTTTEEKETVCQMKGSIKYLSAKIFVSKKSVRNMLFGQMPVSQKSVDQMSGSQMLLDKMFLSQMSVNQMPCQLNHFGQNVLSAKLLVRQMYVGPICQQKVFWPKFLSAKCL